MFAKPQSEHQWLEQLIGTWDIQHCCTMPDGTQSKTTGSMVCRSLGGMWLIAESSGEAADAGPWANLMTIGFDIEKKQFVGTFIGSMMSNIWPYHGVLDETGRRLPLYSEGPKFDGSGIGQYRDTIDIIDPDNWLFGSEILSDDGQWVKFMEGSHHRVVT